MAYESRTRHRVKTEDAQWLLRVLGAAGPETTFALLPSTSRPWVLTGQLGVRPCLRALLHGFGLSTRRQRVIRLVAGAARTIEAVGGGRGESRTDPGQAGSVSKDGLMPRLIETFGPVTPLVLIGEADPNRKPTVQLVTDDGATVGYAKVGWNPATRAMVRRETATLAGLADRERRGWRAPELLWDAVLPDLGLEVLVTRPMPAGTRRRPVADDPDDQILVSIAAATSQGGGCEMAPARAWRWWSTLRERLAALDESTAVPRDATAQVRRAVEHAVASLPVDAAARVGGWHGDLVPWNLGTGLDGLWVWDWEHAGPDRPVGLDLLHHRFAVERHARRQSTADAVEAVRETALLRLPGLGVTPELASAMVTGYLVERWLRAAELAAQGSGWDSAVHPSLVEALVDGLGQPA